MFLEYWMIIVLLCVFGYALYDMYHRGYKVAYVEGGLYGHVSTMQVLQEVLSKEEMERLRDAIIAKGKGKSGA